MARALLLQILKSKSTVITKRSGLKKRVASFCFYFGAQHFMPAGEKIIMILHIITSMGALVNQIVYY